MTISTPESLWASPAASLLRPTAVMCEGVAHTVDGRQVLASIDLSVPVGTRLLVTGRRGSGTGLLLRVLAGLVKPGRGRVEVAGVSADDGTRWRQRVGYAPADLSLYPWLTVGEALGIAARLHRLGRDGRRRGQELAGELGFAAALVLRLSRAAPVQLERLALASALIHDPEVLLLDEPLASVAPAERNALLRLAGEDRTVVLRSRYPGREREVCERVAFLRNGQIAVEAALRELEAARVPLSLSGLEAFDARKR